MRAFRLLEDDLPSLFKLAFLSSTHSCLCHTLNASFTFPGIITQRSTFFYMTTQRALEHTFETYRQLIHVKRDGSSTAKPLSLPFQIISLSVAKEFRLSRVTSSAAAELAGVKAAV